MIYLSCPYFVLIYVNVYLFSDGQLTLIQQPTSISSPVSGLLSGGSSNNPSASNNSSPIQTTSNTLTSLPFFNLTTSMQPTKPLGSKICRWVQVWKIQIMDTSCGYLKY